MALTYSTSALPEQQRSTWVNVYQSVRKCSEELCAPLSPEDYVIQTVPEASRSPLAYYTELTASRRVCASMQAPRACSSDTPRVKPTFIVELDLLNHGLLHGLLLIFLD